MSTQCTGFTMTWKVFIFCVWSFFFFVTHLLLLLTKAVFYIEEKKKSPVVYACLTMTAKILTHHLRLILGWFEKLVSPRVLSQCLLKCFYFGTIV